MSSATPSPSKPGELTTLPGKATRTISARGVTSDDIRRRAERVRELAGETVRETVRDTLAAKGMRLAAAGAGLVVAAVSAAFFAGSMSGKRKAAARAAGPDASAGR